ncbi:hypothetical protein HDE_03014 [Halotydeus destructor]|nr:hypothetical protein HDE_03014 [Halotydeus destructor]
MEQFKESRCLQDSEEDVDMSRDCTSLSKQFRESGTQNMSFDDVNSRVNINQTDDDDHENVDFRRRSYLQFVKSVPRIVSPTICGLTNYRINPECVQDESYLGENFQFNWSIDQVALLNPCEFSSYDIPSYVESAEELIDETREKENEEYFSRKVILPSPDQDKSSCSETDYIKFLKPHSTCESASIGFFSKITPSKDDEDMSVRRSRYWGQTTPMSVSKNRREKKKLFGIGTPIKKVEFSDSDDEVNMSITPSKHFENFGSDENVSFHKLEGSLNFISPIANYSSGNNSNIMCKELIKTNNQVSVRHNGETDKIPLNLPMIQEESSSEMIVSLNADEEFEKELFSDSGCNMVLNEKDLNVKHPFQSIALLKTSTPSRP